MTDKTVYHKNITIDDNADNLSMEALEYGLYYESKQEYEQAIKCYEQVSIDGGEEVFELAQYHLINCSLYLQNTDNIAKYFAIIDNAEMRAQIMFMLINYVVKYGYDLSEIKETIDGHKTYLEYVVHKILDGRRQGNQIHYMNLVLLVYEILDILMIKETIDIAHYTTINGFKALSTPYELMRMSNTQLCNDPLEGNMDRIAFNWEVINNEDIFKSFVGCFSFDVDSLNQFRLYGKNDNKEAEGTCLVYSSDMFAQDYLDYWNHINIDNTVNPLFITKLPLYRCIYVGKDKNDELYIDVSYPSKNQIMKQSGKKAYERMMIEKDNTEKEIYDLIHKMNSEIDEITKGTYDSGLIDLILMPIKHLMKDSAYIEERECRIIEIVPSEMLSKVDNENFTPKVFRDYMGYSPNYLKTIILHQKQEKWLIRFKEHLLQHNIQADVLLSKAPYR